MVRKLKERHETNAVKQINLHKMQKNKPNDRDLMVTIF